MSRRPSRPRAPRPPRVPLPVLHAAERVRGSAMLEEGGRAGWELVLWESYRNVGDWAATPRDRRVPGMFGAGAAERRTEQLRPVAERDPALARDLETVRDLLADPAAADPRAVARACRRVAAWAGASGRPATQFYFAAAAGLCVPEDARQAYETGRLARDLARWDAAEAWLEYAAAAARRRRDRETQAISILGLGNLFYRRGFYQRARDTHLSALALARRHDLREHCGRALHDLFVVAVELRDAPAAESYAREALAAYGGSHPNVPALAHDVSYFWLAEGRADRAFPILCALLPHLVHRPDKRLRVLATTARTAAALGRRPVFQTLLSEVRELSREPAVQRAVAGALLETAVGASLLRDEPLAAELFDAALQVACGRGEVDVIVRVDELRRVPAGESVEVHAPGSVEQRSDDLVTELLTSLESGETLAAVPPDRGARG